MMETVKSLLDEWKILVLLVILGASLISLSPNPWASGLTITNVRDTSPFSGKLEEGMVIKAINDVKVSEVSDLNRYGNYTGTLRMRTSDGLKMQEISNQSLGIDVRKKKKIKLELGLDLQGGTRVILKPNFNNTKLNHTEKSTKVKAAISTLKTRLNVFGLRDMEFQQMKNNLIQVKAVGISKDRKSVV